MAVFSEVRAGRCFMGKLDHGADLLAELTGVCEQNDIRLGRVEAIGAVQKARVGYYEQKSRE